MVHGFNSHNLFPIVDTSSIVYVMLVITYCLFILFSKASHKVIEASQKVIEASQKVIEASHKVHEAIQLIPRTRIKDPQVSPISIHYNTRVKLWINL